VRDSPIYRRNTLFAHLPVCTVDHRTSLVPASTLAEGRYCDRRTISCQLHSFKDTLRINFIFRMLRMRLGLTKKNACWPVLLTVVVTTDAAAFALP